MPVKKSSFCLGAAETLEISFLIFKLCFRQCYLKTQRHTLVTLKASGGYFQSLSLFSASKAVETKVHLLARMPSGEIFTYTLCEDTRLRKQIGVLNVFWTKSPMQTAWPAGFGLWWAISYQAVSSTRNLLISWCLMIHLSPKREVSWSSQRAREQRGKMRSVAQSPGVTWC